VTRIVYGINPVLEALRRCPEDIHSVYQARVDVARRARDAKIRTVEEVPDLCRDARVKYSLMERKEMDRQVGSPDHQGLMARMVDFPYVDEDAVLEEIREFAATGSNAPRLYVALDGVQDPRNLGALIRTAAAFGVRALVLPKDRAAPITGASEKAAAGGTFVLPICRVTNLARFCEQAKEAGAWNYAAVMDAPAIGKVPHNFPALLVLGGEGDGVRPTVVKACHIAASVPMAGGMESLNVSVAGAVMMYELGAR
jgi:23S rRNA (guanosine2251-2'-O)-methyltransferase